MKPYPKSWTDEITGLMGVAGPQAGIEGMGVIITFFSSKIGFGKVVVMCKRLLFLFCVFCRVSGILGDFACLVVFLKLWPCEYKPA